MDDFILEIENFIPTEACRDIIKRYENDDRQIPGETSFGVNKKIKDSVDLQIYDFKDWTKICEYVGIKVHHGLKLYLKRMNELNLNKYNIFDNMIEDCKIGCPQLQKTCENGFYRWHVDTGPDRIFTYILYLNDVGLNDGGTTDFSFGKSVLPKEGKLLIFPSTWTFIHRGKRLEKGVKYIATGFVYDS
jgi:hypothetical protein